MNRNINGNPLFFSDEQQHKQQHGKSRLQFRPRWQQTTTWFQFWTGRVWVIVDLVVLLDLVIFVWEFEKN
jgi:hypothetical protein